MCIFGIRICATDKIFSSGSWLKNDNIKDALERHRVELTISNSTCDSGQMMVAGTIFLKHPVYTHRLYFLLALRRSLPSNTPYFDIAVHRRTPSGIDCPHLVVKCGEQHQDALTEILSDFLDGKQTTALFIGTKLLQSHDSGGQSQPIRYSPEIRRFHPKNATFPTDCQYRPFT